LLNWAQTNRQLLSFEVMNDKHEGARRMFTIGIMLNESLFCEGTAFNKKEAGQVAARKALELIAQKSPEISVP